MKKTLLILMVLALALVLFPAAAFSANDTLGNVKLITGSEIEIEYDVPVLNNTDAHNTFTIRVDGVEVGWEFLSYFDFGPYAIRGGVVNVRLDDPLDAGEPRGRKRVSEAEYYLAETQSVKGPAAAARITVTKKGTPALPTATATFAPFYTERSIGNMSMMWIYGSADAGNNGQQIRDYGTNYSTGNVFSATTEPKYTDEYITRQVAEGINRFVGRSEYLNLPVVDGGFKALIVGPEQSVYEVPEYRELYKYGVTTDTYTRTAIKATEVPGNFDGDKTFKKLYIVGTSDDVMRHYSPLTADGDTASGNADSARPRSDHFYFAEAFFDMYYHLGVVEGCTRFPLSKYNDPEDYRYDHRLTEAYENDKAKGLWPGAKMMASEKNYYIYGALVFFELFPESELFTDESFPVNTRDEMYEYDYDLYYALSAIHGKYEYWTGTGTGQAVNASADSGKYNIPWFWHNQPDNYGLPAAADPTRGVAYEPLKIVKATIVSERDVQVEFNREIRTVADAATAANWRIYIDGREVSVTRHTGSNWKQLRFRTNCSINFATGVVTNAANRLDNGKPYGRYFSGFSQSDLDERSVANGGWIANNQALGADPLEFGQFVSLDEAISKYGAGPVGKVEIAYVGTADVKDWGGNILAKNIKYEAGFEPWIGNAYRCPLTGMYIYLDTACDSEYGGHYKAIDVARAAGLMYEAHLQNNQIITYPTSAGGADFDTLFSGTGSNTVRNGAGDTSSYSWNNGTLTVGTQNITNGPVTYDRVGQRIADGAVRGGGGMIIAAGSVLGHHAGMQPQSNGMGGDISDTLRVEGWGGTTFQTEDVLIMRDYNLCRYKNESLVYHEGGHGIDSFTNGTSNYGQDIYNDISAANATATSPQNGARWVNVSGVAAYCGYRGEYVSTLSSFYAGAMREQFQGINDGTWTPICTREELYRYDPYGLEVFKRIFFSGELGLWYEDQVGDPDYRVMPEDWELLRDTYSEFRHWTSVNDLIAWGASLPETANYNPYTNQKNELSKWTSWKVPNVWDIEPYKVPDPDDSAQKRTNRYDFVGGSAYNPDPAVGSPTENQEHPFFRPGGVKKPERPAELEALANPVRGTITDDHATILSRPVLVQFEFTNYDGEITSNNVQTSFELMVDGQYTHFYLWEFKEVEPGVATVTLRLDWPLEADAEVVVGLRAEQPAKLKLATDAHLVDAGDYFRLYPIFTKPVASNAATLEFTFDKDLFEYRGFTPAEGVTLLNTEQTDTGAKFTLMTSGYATKQYGEFLFSAKEDINLANEDYEISVTANYVVKLEDGTKEVWKSTASTTFIGDDIEPGDIDLITLSNLIDVFGMKKNDPRWPEYRVFDRNNNGQIDINDITYVAQQIK